MSTDNRMPAKDPFGTPVGSGERARVAAEQLPTVGRWPGGPQCLTWQEASDIAVGALVENERRRLAQVGGEARYVLDQVISPIVEELRAEVGRLTVERDLAIAHDCQPYPTAEAYERVCAALEKHRQRADVAEAEVERLTTELTEAQHQLAGREERQS